VAAGCFGGGGRGVGFGLELLLFKRGEGEPWMEEKGGVEVGACFMPDLVRLSHVER
jgi:hypothetical protein